MIFSFKQNAFLSLFSTFSYLFIILACLTKLQNMNILWLCFDVSKILIICLFLTVYGMCFYIEVPLPKGRIYFILPLDVSSSLYIAEIAFSEAAVYLSWQWIICVWVLIYINNQQEPVYFHIQ